jgi:hypothetical protein
MGVFLSVYSKKCDCEKYITNDKLKEYDESLHIDWEHRSYIKSSDSSYAFINFSRKNIFNSAEEQSFVSTSNSR